MKVQVNRHMAVATDDIINTVDMLRSRGVEFLSIPPEEYYSAVPLRLEKHNHKLNEDINTLKIRYINRRR